MNRDEIAARLKAAGYTNPVTLPQHELAWLLERADALAAALERICEESHTDLGMLDAIHHIAQGALADYRRTR